MRMDHLRQQAWKANMDLVSSGLVTLTWGNASAIDRQAGVVAIKPSGVDYADLQVEQMVLLKLETGEPLEETSLLPSSDTATHLHLYRSFQNIGGVIHTHSKYATSWAQSGREIPCLGTTHADHFYGPIPLTRELTPGEIDTAYEHNTGVVITERFLELDALHYPGVLVPWHGPFTWGATVAKAVENAIALEVMAEMALHTLALAPSRPSIPNNLLDKHFQRKHGKTAYYGQK